MPDDELRAQVAIEHTVAHVASYIDARRWVQLRGLYADEVETDYSSLFGGEPQRTDADALIAIWERRLSPLRATQHLLGPITVSVRGSRGVAECHVRGYHFLEGMPGGDEWMIAGHYVFELVEIEGAWKIAKMTLETFYQTGNRDLLEQAARG